MVALLVGLTYHVSSIGQHTERLCTTLATGQMSRLLMAEGTYTSAKGA